jgi:Xaa-Pro aminopeptidase
LEVFRRAGQLLDRVAAGVLASIRVGLAEREIAADIDFRLKTGGFEGLAFDTIVASGPNSALPHARPGPRVLGPGDLVVLDFGGVYGGYCVDLSRTVCVGEPSAEAQRLYDAVFEAQSAALSMIRPGVRVSQIDQAARQVLERRGLGSAFGHATGHGLGLEVHEEPRVGPLGAGVPGVAPVTRDEVLEAGVVITVEPGVYVAGVGGVRIEDDVAVVAGGAELLTHVDRKLLVV